MVGTRSAAFILVARSLGVDADRYAAYRETGLFIDDDAAVGSRWLSPRYADAQARRMRSRFRRKAHIRQARHFRIVRAQGMDDELPPTRVRAHLDRYFGRLPRDELDSYFPA